MSVSSCVCPERLQEDAAAVAVERINGERDRLFGAEFLCML